MADMRGFGGIGAGVCEDDFARKLGGGWCRFGRGFLLRFAPERGAIEKRIQVARSSNVNSRDAFDGANLSADFFSDLARGALELLGKLETHGRSNFAHLQTRRARNRHVGGDFIAPANELLQSRLKSPCERVVHEPPYGREKPKSIGKRRPVARARSNLAKASTPNTNHQLRSLPHPFFATVDVKGLQVLCFCKC